MNYHPNWRELLGVALALGGIVMFVVGLILVRLYAGKGTFG